MLKEYIKKFQYGDFEFIGADIYFHKELCFLIERLSGTTMLASKSIGKKIKNHILNDDLCVKLLQRGFMKSSQSLLRYCDIKELHKPTLFLIELTKNCNLRCKYCFRNFNDISHLPDLSLKQNTISEETIKKICEYISKHYFKNRMNKLTIQIWGGEPLLYIDKIVSIKINLERLNVKAKIVVQTNGTLITPQIAQIIAENDIHIGISMDGPAKLQNFQRKDIVGRSTHNKVLEGIKNLEKAGVSFGILSVITNYSAEMIEDVLDFFAKELRVGVVKFNIMHPNQYSANDMFFNEKKAKDFSERLLNKLISLNREGFSIIERTVRDRIENLLINSNGGFCEAKGCQYGKYMVGFDINGNIYPCELIGYPEECVGNIEQDGDLNKLLTDSFEKQSFFVKTPDLDPECSECSFWAGCRGGCASAVKYNNDEHIKTDKALCSINKNIYPKLIKLLLEDLEALNLLFDEKIKIIGR